MSALKIAVVGSGISGIGAAWHLSKNHDVAIFESEDWVGGHANTASIKTKDGVIDVDTGFIVYNTNSYPNFCAILSHLNVVTDETEMTFSVSLDNGNYEYSGSSLSSFFGQPSNIVSRQHWTLLKDIARFFRTAETHSANISDEVTLGEFLEKEKYSDGFIDRHVLPMGSAIWSANKSEMLKFPARSFIMFFANHGMLRFFNRPRWKTIKGGSKQYVSKLIADGSFEVRKGTYVTSVNRVESGVEVEHNGTVSRFDHVIIATHADQALRMLRNPTKIEEGLLSAFSYQTNRTLLHRDETVMPIRKRIWASWNYVQSRMKKEQPLSVTYWMNRLQNLPTSENIFVTLNPTSDVAPHLIEAEFDYTHPIFNVAARRAQLDLWQLQRQNRTWFCGSYFGHGFHEDGLQSGLAVAEQLGGVRRPWQVPNESGRISLPDSKAHRAAAP